MILIYSLILATILSLLFTTSIKKHYWFYYSLSAFIAISTTIYEILKITSNMELYGFISYIEKASIKGIFSISVFVLVMFAGALQSRWKITKKLLIIRGELAIIASILILPHGVIYLVRFIMKIIDQKLSAIYVAYVIVGIIAFIIMIPLFITSLKKIKRKMDWHKWKQLQRTSYLFYFITYIHILLILLSKKNIDWIKLITYTTIFALYAILRLIKCKNTRQA
ncbi:ferric reductase-like transmembrane domain-containing protein [Clostridium gasigenes]|uniref:Ferric reductase-like transmembrane domain-containing protein n=1 Tax=Clostridium gasigenes TaxID=94869 RepID=A0A7X0S9B3_9CLOT|nr:ferric reductase-like transmembrane domain-containing protein [Clostridium gasigenes]MBB6713364.1 ferric reductase-like transmembrane domain-containing protein [Clostridium gasigenes]MBU3104600.1 ferric reductase-like transmembrane domain-containing protein [Clostridium gasigenes]